jgi:hypothetical protein
MSGALRGIARRAGFLRVTEPALALLMRVSEYARRQLRFTPFPTGPVAWMIDQAGTDLFLFSSDYPHIEGGRNPIKRFESSMRETDEDAKDKFYAQFRRPDVLRNDLTLQALPARWVAPMISPFGSA